MRYLYGIGDTFWDVTQKAKLLGLYLGCNNLYVQKDTFSHLFGDPVYGEHKVLVCDKPTLEVYTEQHASPILELTSIPEPMLPAFPISKKEVLSDEEIDEILRKLHEKTVILYENISWEYPEQCLAIKHIKSHNKVLEIGGSVGRCATVISHILDKQENLVTLETDPDQFKRLCVNRAINRRSFQVVNATLSSVPLYQHHDHVYTLEQCKERNVSLHIPVKTMTFDELQTLCNVKFDVMWIDCEGSFLGILKMFPAMLDNVQLLMIENDFQTRAEMDEVIKMFIDRGFKIIDARSGTWGPCIDMFHQIWAR